MAGTVAAALLAGYLLHLGAQIRDAHSGYLSRCPRQGGCADVLAQFAAEYQNTLLILAALLGMAPALFAMFWGAPLVARELEAGTHRLVWTQSVTRRRWLVIKLLLAVLAAAAVTGLASTLLTWAAGPVDQIADDRFSTVVFGARHLAPVAAAVLGVVVGAAAGLLTRRTVPAMALAFLAVLVVQFAVPNLVRPHLMPAVTVDRPMTADAINEVHGLGSITGSASVRGLTVPDAWVTGTSDLLTADGRPLDPLRFDACLAPPNATTAASPGRFGAAAQCLGALDLHVRVTYQPDHRYWPFQIIESLLLLAAAALVAALCLWRIRHST